MVRARPSLSYGFVQGLSRFLPDREGCSWACRPESLSDWALERQVEMNRVQFDELTPERGLKKQLQLRLMRISAHAKKQSASGILHVKVKQVQGFFPHDEDALLPDQIRGGGK